MKQFQKLFSSNEIQKFHEGMYIVDEFSQRCQIKKENEICQLWVQSASYGGHQAYTTIEAKKWKCKHRAQLLV